jgi:hypothetical protein
LQNQWNKPSARRSYNRWVLFDENFQGLGLENERGGVLGLLPHPEAGPPPYRFQMSWFSDSQPN